MPSCTRARKSLSSIRATTPTNRQLTSPAAAQTFMIGTALAAKTTMRNYPAPAAILSAVYEGTLVPMDAALAVESKYFGQLLSGPVARNLMRTMFINKGLADKLNRRPSAPPSWPGAASWSRASAPRRTPRRWTCCAWTRPARSP